jgi:cellobiose-specific phosphotransferase system component IIC
VILSQSIVYGLSYSITDLLLMTSLFVFYAVATPLILCFLSGEQFAMPAVLAASIVSLMATGYVPFIKSQLVRSDIDFSLYYKEKRTRT